MEFSKAHLSDESLTRGLAEAVRNERGATLEVLAHIAEFSRRRLFRQAGYSSMHKYCVHELKLSEQAAFKRVTAARLARRFPELFEAIADGRVHLTGLLLIGPHLREWNIRELLELATHRSRREIEELLATRFPKPDAPTRIELIAQSTSDSGVVSAPVNDIGAAAADGPAPSCAVIPRDVQAAMPSSDAAAIAGASTANADSETCQELSPGRVSDISNSSRVADYPRITPLAPERYALQVTIDRGTRDLIDRVRDLAGFEASSDHVSEILKRALAVLVSQLEKRKFAATDKPRAAVSEPVSDSRTIPAWVKRAVWQRDEGRCTYVSPHGVRCDSKRVEFDHVIPFACGGESSVANVRLLCRPHNQLAAEEQLGAEFMRSKRA